MNKINRFIYNFILLLTIQLFGQTVVPEEGLESITPQELKVHVYFLASDSMKGRDTPSHELDSCAAYIASEFESYGLGTEHHYQRFNLLRSRLSSPNLLTISTPDGYKEYKIKYDFVPLRTTANKRIEDRIVVFAGYGITAPEYGYDDYAGIDVVGKVVLVFTGEPQEDDSTSVFEGRRDTEYSMVLTKVMNASDHGAAGLLIVTKPDKRFLRPPNYWPSLMRKRPKGAVPLTLDENTGSRVVCMRIGRKAAEDVFKYSGTNMKEVFELIDQTLIPHSFDIDSITVTMQTTLVADTLHTQNVFGLWEGCDPELKNEFVIIGAHYDHIGIVNGEICNGADDNASGTAGLMEIAEAFTKCRRRPRRSILFIAFSGEEKGLFGSRYYVNHPLFPLKKSVAMLNLDMISRNDTNEVAIIGSFTSSFLRKSVEEANTGIGMKLLYDQDRYFIQSDHYSFYRKGIPVILFNSKDTPDLHRPTDDPEKTIPEKMARISKLVFSTAWLVANRTERPDFIKSR